MHGAQVQHETMGVLKVFFLAIDQITGFSAGDRDFRAGIAMGLVITDPAGIVAAGLDLLDGERAAIEPIDRRFSVASLLQIPQGPDDIDPVIDKRCGVEIGRRKHLFRIAENLELAVAVVHDGIVVDAEIRIVVVLVLAGDL